MVCSTQVRASFNPFLFCFFTWKILFGRSPFLVCKSDWSTHMFDFLGLVEIEFRLNPIVSNLYNTRSTHFDWAEPPQKKNHIHITVSLEWAVAQENWAKKKCRCYPQWFIFFLVISVIILLSLLLLLVLLLLLLLLYIYIYTRVVYYWTSH